MPKNNGRKGITPRAELWSTWQPAGQRVADKLRWAYELVAIYGPLHPEVR